VKKSTHIRLDGRTFWLLKGLSRVHNTSIGKEVKRLVEAEVRKEISKRDGQTFDEFTSDFIKIAIANMSDEQRQGLSELLNQVRHSPDGKAVFTTSRGIPVKEGIQALREFMSQE